MSDGLTQAEAERLVLLIEECSEVIKVATKVLRHGYHAEKDGVSYDNKGDLETELGDVLYVVSLMDRRQDVDLKAIEALRYRKALKLDHYVHCEENKSTYRGV